MGEMAEYYMDLAMEQEAEMEAEEYFRAEAIRGMERNYMMGVLLWTGNDGKSILVQDLGYKHLENCISFLKRMARGDVRGKWVELLGYEMTKRNATKALLNKGK
jgi:hypothetical protein|tara:strand:+ start:16419 stop:16730 length:312 start_codon:yes stop_codon:yes gene_type:complete